jgi:hypothetical protein
MQPKDIRRINKRKRFNRLSELINALEMRDIVAFVEAEGVSEHVVTKPDLAVCGQKTSI